MQLTWALCKPYPPAVFPIPFGYPPQYSSPVTPPSQPAVFITGTVTCFLAQAIIIILQVRHRTYVVIVVACHHFRLATKLQSTPLAMTLFFT